jgi:hypothetical protein
MKTMEWRFVAKDDWGTGPWNDEPDKVQFPDEASGMPCLIRRGPSGALCGYVGVAEGHPWFAKSYGACIRDCGQGCYEHSPEMLIDVHGGLTYSEFCSESENGICHVPDHGEPDRVWWFGFDCAHAGDLSPSYAHLVPGFGDEKYRPLDYVRRETARLATQLAALA